MRTLCSLALFAVALPLMAQQSKVIPSGMDFVEGPQTFTYPFGRVDTGLYVLFDADQVTTAQGLLTGMNFRPTQTTSSSLGYTKPYRVTAYTVPTTAAQMYALGSPFVAANLVGSAVGTVLFQGNLTLPATGPLTVTPAPFNINIPFTTPYVYDGTQGNLLLLLETTDATAVPGTYRVDAVQFRNSLIEGVAQDIDTVGCAAGGASLVVSTAASSVILGSQIDTTVAASAGGILSVAFATLGFVRQDLDLAPFGLPGCTSRGGASFVSQLLIDTGTGFPHAFWAVPNDPSFIGLPLVTQAVGLPASGAGAAVSNAQALRVGPNTFPTVKSMMAWRVGTSWFQGQVGQYIPVMRLDGVFP